MDHTSDLEFEDEHMSTVLTYLKDINRSSPIRLILTTRVNVPAR